MYQTLWARPGLIPVYVANSGGGTKQASGFVPPRWSLIRNASVAWPARAQTLNGLPPLIGPKSPGPPPTKTREVLLRLHGETAYVQIMLGMPRRASRNNAVGTYRSDRSSRSSLSLTLLCLALEPLRRHEPPALSPYLDQVDAGQASPYRLAGVVKDDRLPVSTGVNGRI